MKTEDVIKNIVKINAEYLEKFEIKFKDVTMLEKELANNVDFLRNVKALQINDSLNDLFDLLINVQMEALMKHGSDPNKDILVRGSLNGVFLLKELINDFASMYNDEIQTHDSADKQ